jgi:hypothetical protein
MSTRATMSRMSGSWMTKRKPSARSAQYEGRGVATVLGVASVLVVHSGLAAARTASDGTNAQVSSAERAKVAALTNSAATGPTSATSSPAIEAPMSLAKRSDPSSRPTLCSRRTPARSVSSGSITRRAVWPGVSSRPPANTSARSAQNGRPTVRARIGMASTVTPLITSALRAARRWPTRSTTTPPSAPPTTTGAVAKNAATPTSTPVPPCAST